MHKLRLDLVKESEAIAVDAEDDVYEEIEAPKFVDFTVPDRSRPDNGSWFCTRIGCDQMHEEIDPDALHRNFRLRVIAARSPNVRRHRKTFDRESPSLKPKCPRSAPAKTAKSRTLGLSTMVSVPEKTARAKLQDHPISSLRFTPSQAKARVQHRTNKVALTTPRNRKCPTTQEGFRSMRHQRKPVSVVTDRIVAKVLFADTNTSNTKERPAEAIQSKCNSSVSEVDAEVKKLRGGRTRTVPSRYLCILATPKSSKRDEESTKCLKKAEETRKNVELKSEDYSKLCDPSKFAETNHDKSNDMEADEKLGSQSVSDPMREEHLLSLAMTSAKDCIHALDSVESAEADDTSLNNLRKVEIFQKETELDISLPDASCKPDIEVQKEATVTELDDDKENVSDTIAERVMNSISENHANENMESVARENVPRKTLRSQSKPSADRGKHTRSTNPKPFKLRVDERQILKEAHQAQKATEQKLRERQILNEEHRGHKATEQKLRAVVTQGKTPQKTQTRPLKVTSLKKTTLKDRSMVTPKKLPDPEMGKEHNIKSPASTLKRRRPLKVVSPKKTPLEDRSVVTPKKLPDSQMLKEHDTKSPASTLKRRRPATVPKEPNFHRLHLPRDCAKRAAGGEAKS